MSRELGITAARSSVYARRHARARASRRRGPVGAAPDAVLVGHIRRVSNHPWRGVPESVGEAAGRGDPHLEGAGAAVNAGARPPGPAPRRHDHHGGPRCDVGNGLTATVTIGRGRRLCSGRSRRTTECIVTSISAKSLPVRGPRSVRASANASAPLAAHGLRLRHELADDFQQEVAFLIESSPSFVREPEGTRFIRR